MTSYDLTPDEIDEIAWNEMTFEPTICEDDVGLPIHDDVSQLVNEISFCILTTKGPHWWFNPEFEVLFRDREVFDGVASLSPLSFPPDMLEVLMEGKPPSIDWFSSLPNPPKSTKLWGVYALVMTKPGHSDRLYIGSGTSVEGGVMARIPSHKPECEIHGNPWRRHPHLPSGK